MTLTFRGTNKHGTAVAGQVDTVTPLGIGAFVRAKFKAGWRTLEVRLAPDRDVQPTGPGPIVGRIELSPDHHRVWWAESTEFNPPATGKATP